MIYSFVCRQIVLTFVIKEPLLSDTLCKTPPQRNTSMPLPKVFVKLTGDTPTVKAAAASPLELLRPEIALTGMFVNPMPLP